MTKLNADNVSFRLIDDDPGKVGLEITDGTETFVVSGTVPQLRGMANSALTLSIPRSAYATPPAPEPDFADEEETVGLADDEFEQLVRQNAENSTETVSLLKQLVEGFERFASRYF
jgi:hypothetical protein